VLSDEQIRELSELYLAPECAEPLIRRALDVQAPKLSRRSRMALEWLDTECDDPATRPRTSEPVAALARSVGNLVAAMVLQCDQAKRQRISGLLSAILDEVQEP
jgi:hypothetical protein